MASRYRKIDPRIWNDGKFRTLSDDGKLVFLFLLTHPHMTALGAMRGTFPGLAAELGWSPKRFISAAQECLSRHIVELNVAAAWIGIPNFLRYNEPEGPNSVSKAWALALDMLPECPEKQGLIERCRIYLIAQSDAFKHAMGHAIWDAFGDAKSEPCHIQEQEQEQEQECSGHADLIRFTPEQIHERWNAIPASNHARHSGRRSGIGFRYGLKTIPPKTGGFNSYNKSGLRISFAVARTGPVVPSMLPSPGFSPRRISTRCSRAWIFSRSAISLSVTET